MTKETKKTPLEALEKIKYKLSGTNANNYWEDLDIIENAIKDYQLHEEILNDYGFTLANFREACLVLAQFRGIGFTGIENKLKALEIIKEMLNLKFDDKAQTISYKTSVYERTWSFIDKNEYELVKEVLL